QKKKKIKYANMYIRKRTLLYWLSKEYFTFLNPHWERIYLQIVITASGAAKGDARGPGHPSKLSKNIYLLSGIRTETNIGFGFDTGYGISGNLGFGLFPISTFSVSGIFFSGNF